jgi:3D (Asp-Asp-Asp) domain-containing protein
MNVLGWGWGVVEDRGGAIKGPDRIDLFHKSHRDALEWGRKTLEVEVCGG